MRRAAAIALFAASAVFAAYSAGNGDSTWTLGIAEMPEVSHLSAESIDMAALYSLPALVLGRLVDLQTRFVPEAERLAKSEKERLAALYSTGAAAAALRDKRDSASLSASIKQKRIAEERTIRSEYSKKRAELMDPGEMSKAFADTAPEIALWGGHASGVFLKGSEDPQSVCRTEKLDYLVRWSVRRAGVFYSVRMEGWNAALGRSDFDFIVYCSADNLAPAADELAYAVTRAASGCPSARILFKIQPVGAKLFLDGRQIVSGKSSVRVYEERDYRVSAKAEGYREEEITLHPSFGGVSEAILSLIPIKETDVVVSSVPPGAYLYLDGIWAGITPITLPLYGTSRSVLLSLSGFDELLGVMDPRESRDVSFALEATGEESSSVFERKKDRFYNALGFLVVSLPISIVTYGMYLENALLYNEYPDNKSFARRNDVWLGCFTTATGVTAALFVNAAIQLVRYIKSAR